jgi:hypothetical protein
MSYQFKAMEKVLDFVRPTVKANYNIIKTRLEGNTTEVEASTTIMEKKLEAQQIQLNP